MNTFQSIIFGVSVTLTDAELSARGYRLDTTQIHVMDIDLFRV